MSYSTTLARIRAKHLDRGMAKRVTSEEKIAKIVAFFKKKPEFYVTKELEKLIPKICGISPMQLEEFVNAAVDENFVNREKVGASNVYWAFENQEKHTLTCECERLELSIQNYEKDEAEKRKHLSVLEEEQEETEERKELLKRYNALKKRVTEIENIIKREEECSSKQYRANEEKAQKEKDEINAITENIFVLQGYVCKKYGMDRRDFNARVGIPESFDYLE